MLMIRKLYFILHLGLFTTAFAHAQLQPTSALSMFMGDNINSSYGERDMAISPDGKEMYYTITGLENTFSAIVYRTKNTNGSWSQPEVVSFSGKYRDLEPAFTADGKKMFFSSNRPLKGEKTKDFDIWVTERIKSGWSEPVNIGSPVNTPGDEFYPSLAANGNLYFTAQRTDGIGKEDIFLSRNVQGVYQSPIPLDTAVNSKKWEFNAFVSPDEKFILFTAYGRTDDQGGGDLYISLKDKNDQWLPAQNLQWLNSVKLDYCPYVTTDGSALIFTSSRHAIPESFTTPQTFQDLTSKLKSVENGTDNLYWINFKNVLETVR